eukprot:gene13612-41125_t
MAEGAWNPDGGGQHSGKVKMWNAAKGYIKHFCHHGDIGGRSLVKDGDVTYDLQENSAGSSKMKAINVSGAGKGKWSEPEEPPWNPDGGGAYNGTVKLWVSHKGDLPTPPQGHVTGDSARFSLAGMEFEVQVPPGKWEGQTFAVNL